MPRVIFIQQDGQSRVVEAKAGMSVMEAAIQNNVAGIEAECGGSCSCATCHVYLDDAALSNVAPADELEDEMLDCTADERMPNSRLSCQIILTENLAEITVHVPEAQI